MTERELLEFMKNVSEDVRRLNQTLLEQGVQLPLPTVTAEESPLEEKFVRMYHAMFPSAFEEMQREYRFHTERRWRFDFAHVQAKVAVELEGGLYSNGRHNRAQGFLDDCDKYNAAAYDGWLVFRLGTGQITSDRLAMVQETIQGRRRDGRGTPANPHGSIQDGTRPQTDES